jgi:riboflavin synthase
MFTGIIETTGKVNSLDKKGSNLRIGIQSPFTKELAIGQSVAHNGVCLTVESKNKQCYFVTAIKETLVKTNLGLLKKGTSVNLERCLKVGDRLDGHFVQGHVDCTARIKSILKEKGSSIFEFEISGPKSFGQISSLVIEKGSICINGVSLTVVEVSPAEGAFSVAIIPHTFKHTNFNALKKGDSVNIEFDILGKYILTQMKTISK